MTTLTALTDPTAVVFELVDDTPGSGLTLDQAYALLTGADTSVFGVPKITVAAFDPNQPRDKLGMWSKLAGKLAYKPLSVDEARKFATPQTKLQRAAVHHYSGTGYETMNADARSGREFTRPIDRVAYAQLEGMLKPSPRAALLYRGTTISDLLGSDFNHNDIDALRAQVGRAFTVDNMTSTTIDVSALAELEHSIVLEIEAPKGTRAAYIADTAVTPQEREMLLAPKLRYRIVSVDTRKKPHEYTQAVVRVRIEA